MLRSCRRVRRAHCGRQFKKSDQNVFLLLGKSLTAEFAQKGRRVREGNLSREVAGGGEAAHEYPQIPSSRHVA